MHAYERDRPERPWAGTLTGPAEVTGDDMVAAMDAVGVDGALLVSRRTPCTGTTRVTRWRCTLNIRASSDLIRPFDPTSDAIEDEMRDWTSHDGVVGARIMLTYGDYSADDPGLARILDAAADCGVPVNLMCSGHLPLFRALAGSHPNTRMVIDHVGIEQPRQPPAPPDAWADLDAVAALAEFDNVAIKISGACTLSLCSRSPTPTSGSRWASCSARSVSTAVCGGRTGRAPATS